MTGAPNRDEDEAADRRHEMGYLLLAAAMGAAVGLAGALFHLIIARLSAWPAWLAAAVPNAPLLPALGTMVLAVLAAWLVRRFAPESAGSGVQEVEGAMAGWRPLRWRRVLPVKFVAGVLAIASGLVLGREGPTVHIGASIAAAAADGGRVDDIGRRGLLAAGAAAGLAAAFNAPLAAIVFIIEETRRQFPWTFRTYLAVIIATVAATIVTELVGGTALALPVAAAAVPLAHLPAFALLGAFLGAVGVALNAGLIAALDLAGRRWPGGPLLFTALAGLAVGLVAVLLPRAAGGGELLAREVLVAAPGPLFLLGLAAVRFVTGIASYAAGAPGGIFAPILALATCLGLAFGALLQPWLPGAVPLAFAVAAMAGLFTASVRAPVVGVVLALDLTGAYALTLPLLVTVIAADLVARWLGGRPIYARLLERTLARAGDQGR